MHMKCEPINYEITQQLPIAKLCYYFLLTFISRPLKIQILSFYKGSFHQSCWPVSTSSPFNQSHDECWHFKNNWLTFNKKDQTYSHTTQNPHQMHKRISCSLVFHSEQLVFHISWNKNNWGLVFQMQTYIYLSVCKHSCEALYSTLSLSAMNHPSCL